MTDEQLIGASPMVDVGEKVIESGYVPTAAANAGGVATIAILRGMSIMRLISLMVAVHVLGIAASSPQTAPADWRNVRVLVYTKNGAGYVHQNIPASVEAIRDLGRQKNFSVDVSDDPTLFTDSTLKKYTALVFSNTNNIVFDTDAQRVALMRYVQAGGGVVAIHSASGTERAWRWFARMLGGTFSRHAPFQKFGVVVVDRSHPSVAHLPDRWEKDDEAYYLVGMNVNMRILAVNDLSTVEDQKGKPTTFGDVFPSVWCQEFDGGRQWYTSLGHSPEDYRRPEFRQHILGGIEWVARGHAPLDYSRAYAMSPADEPRKR